MKDNEDLIALTKRVIEHLRWSGDDDKNAEVLSRVFRGGFNRVAEEEREACAKIAESFDMPAPGSAASTWLDCGRMRNEIAAAIRARGESNG